MPWSQDYQMSELAVGLIQVTYKSAHVNDDGELSRRILRSSIWQQVAGKWKMRFHQGTPTAAFVKNVT